MEDFKMKLKYIYRIIFLVCISLSILNINSFAQETVPNYTLTEEASNFSALNGNVLFSSGDEVGLLALPSLPFSFPFDGENYTRISVHPQGWISLGENNNIPDHNNLIELQNPILAVLWDEFDVQPSDEGLSSTVSYDFQEENGRQIVIVEWRGMRWDESAARYNEGATISFQVKLYDNGEIVFLYNLNNSDISFTLDPSAGIVQDNIGATIGLGGITFSSFTNVKPFTNGLEESTFLSVESSLHAKALKFAPSEIEQPSFEYLISQDNNNARPNEVGAAVLKIKISASSHYNSTTINTFSFNTAGTSNTYDIKNARLFYTGSNNTLSLNNQYGSTIIEPNGTFSFNATQYPLSTGDNYFWLCYDVSNTAIEGNLLDAKVSSFTLSNGSAISPANAGNPAGAKIILELVGARGPNVPPIPVSDYTINWEETRTFDELGNLVSQERKYSDGLGRVTQIQNKIGNDITAIANVFDAFGRPALSTLPAPLAQQNIIQFAANFISLPNGIAYSYNDFDIGTKLNNPTPIGTTAGTLGWYYSNQNSLEPYVPADSYPYTRVEYSDDPTSQIKRTNMAGEHHRFGSGHEMRNYTMSSGGELAYVYGYHKSYIKNHEGNYANVAELLKLKKSINIDPDGKTSIVFTNLSGKTIATCRSGSANNCTSQKISQSIKFLGTKSLDIHLPKAKNNSLKFNFPSWYTTNSANIVLTITDINKGVIIPNNSSNGANYYVIGSEGNVVFYGTYAAQDNYLRISCVIPDYFLNQAFSYPNLDVPLQYELDYSHWTLNYYDVKGNLLEEVSPKAIDCTFNPLASNVQSSWQSGTFSTNQLNPPNNTAQITLNAAQQNHLRFLSADIYALPLSPNSGGGDPQRPATPQNINVVAMEEDNGGGVLWSYTPTDPSELSREVIHKYTYKLIGTSTNGEVQLNLSPVVIFLNMKFYNNGNIWAKGGRVIKYFDNEDLKDAEGIEFTQIRVEIIEHEVYVNNIVTGYNSLTYVTYDNNNVEHNQDLSQYSLHYSFNVKNLLLADAVNHNSTILNTYNDLNQLVKNNSPDEGSMEFVYDAEGKLRFSQNSEQLPSGRFSYINYDEAGRIIETGEYDPNLPGDPEINPSFYYFFETSEEYNPVVYNNKISVIAVLNNTGYLSNYRCTQQMYSSYDKKSTDFPVSSGVNVQKNVQGKLGKTWNEHSSTWYSYDAEGKLIEVVKGINAISGYKTFHYVYDYWGNVINSEYQKGNVAERLDHIFTYNNKNDLDSVSTSKYGNTLTHAKYSYYKHGALKRLQLGGTEKTQGLDYVYTINGWLKSINDPTLGSRDPGDDNFDGSHSTFAKDVFGFSLHYFSGDYKRQNTYVQYATVYSTTGLAMENKYNGLTMGLRWQSTMPFGANNSYTNQVLACNYLYTEQNELKEYVFATATAGDGNRPANVPTADDVSVLTALPEYRMTTISYDLNGNLQSLKRDGNNIGAAGNPYKMDELQYAYSSTPNRLTAVNDVVAANVRQEDVDAGVFTYDAIGRMIVDGTRSAKYTYNIYGMVTSVRDAVTNELKVTYTYDDGGLKLSRTTYSGGAAVIVNYYVNDASGSLVAVYDKDNTNSVRLIEQTIYGAGRLGTYYALTNKYVYELNDHQGNVRVVIGRQRVNNQAEVLAYMDYDAMGNILPGRAYYAENYRFGYQGQEVNDLLGWNEFEARMYDPGLGRWLVPDPAGQFHSPYLAMGNAGHYYTDPDGRLVPLLVLGAALVGGAYNLYNNIHKVDNFGSGLAYFTVGAVAGATVVIDPTALHLSAAFVATSNLSIDMINGKVPNGENVVDLLKYSAMNILNAYGVASVGSMFNAFMPPQVYADKLTFEGMLQTSDELAIIGDEVTTIKMPYGGLNVGDDALIGGEKFIKAANESSRFLRWGSNAKGHLIKHADELGFGGHTPQQLQKMLPQLKSAANQLYNNVNPALTRIGRWGTLKDDVLMHITNNGKMLITKQNGEFITVINKTSNNWYQLAKPFR
jgi:RHS repeat-associated protein